MAASPQFLWMVSGRLEKAPVQQKRSQPHLAALGNPWGGSPPLITFENFD